MRTARAVRPGAPHRDGRSGREGRAGIAGLARTGACFHRDHGELTMPLLGCIADDFTGATDLASMLVRNGMRTVQVIGVPAPDEAPPEADAVVVALKSRTIPATDAVRQSLEALRWLQGAGCRQFFFKYCSTFD